MMKDNFDSLAYRLTSPGVIEEVKIERILVDGWVAVEPSLASVCHADLRYYTGSRRPETLAKKMPMALLHEGIGIVVDSMSDKFLKGDRVAIVPNIPGSVLSPETKQKPGIPANYMKNGAFLASGYDGIAQSLLIHPAECLVKIPDSVPDDVAVLAELSTVSYHAISHVRERLMDKTTQIALFGDGPVGYFTAAMIRYMYGVKKENFIVFGADDERLSAFDFARTENVKRYDFENNKERFDIVIEGTGGKFSEVAINQAINVADSIADIILLGVTEEKVPINTRDALEKGLTLYGSSRSSTEDFQAVIDAFSNDDYRRALAKILPETAEIVTNGEEFNNVMRDMANNHAWKKTLIKFQW